MKGSLSKLLLGALMTSGLTQNGKRPTADDLANVKEINSVKTPIASSGAPVPGKFLNQRQRRKLWRQAPHMRKKQSKRA